MALEISEQSILSGTNPNPVDFSRGLSQSPHFRRLPITQHRRIRDSRFPGGTTKETYNAKKPDLDFSAARIPPGPGGDLEQPLLWTRQHARLHRGVLVVPRRSRACCRVQSKG